MTDGDALLPMKGRSRVEPFSRPRAPGLAGTSAPWLSAGPSLTFIAVTVAVGAPCIAGSLWGGVLLLAREGPFGPVVVLPPLCLGAWLVLQGSTVRLRLSADRLWLSRYGKTQWSILRDAVELHGGASGETGPIVGFKVIDRASGRQVGEIVSGQFEPMELDHLVRALMQPTPSAPRPRRTSAPPAA